MTNNSFLTSAQTTYYRICDAAGCISPENVARKMITDKFMYRNDMLKNAVFNILLYSVCRHMQEIGKNKITKKLKNKFEKLKDFLTCKIIRVKSTASLQYNT